MRARTLTAAAALTVVAGGGGYLLATLGDPSGAAPAAGGDEREIAYWVAPMDASYRRDEPGKSPMGMDLVPVYADEAGGGGEPSIRIDPSVVNNLGVRTEAISLRTAGQGIDTTGTIEVDDEAVSDVHTRTEGWIERLAVKAQGERVEAGDLLFELYAPTLVAAQTEYLQALTIGRESFTEAAEERLIALGMTAGQVAALRRSGEPSRRLAVHAPHDGVLTSLDVREGMYLKPEMRAMQIADLSEVWAIADVFESQAARLGEGLPATMTMAAFPGEVWEGTVDYVYPAADRAGRTVPVRLRFENEGGRLRPGMYTEVRIESGAEGSVLTVPQSALIRSSQGDRVILALGEGRFRPAGVETGMDLGDAVEIVAGLDEGERIVTSGQFLIDSEASMDAALLRLSAPSEAKTEPVAGMDMASNEASDSAVLHETTGVIERVDAETGEAMIDHEPIASLGWPRMTMRFVLGPDVATEDLASGDEVSFAFAETDDGYEVVKVSTPGSAEDQDPSEGDVAATGRVMDVSADGSTVMLDHEPVPELGWPGMQMRFALRGEVETRGLGAGDVVSFRFRQTDAGYEITQIEEAGR